jgi:hypothetical protein
MSVDIEALAGERWFNELTPGERHEALAELGSPEAYDGIRSAILRARTALAPDMADPIPRPADTADLRAAMRRRAERMASARPSPLARLLHYRIPAYQPALLAVALLLFFVIWRPQPAVQEKIVYLPATDTATRVADQGNGDQIAGSAIDRAEEKLDREKIVQEVVDSLTRELDRRERKESRMAALRARSERRGAAGDEQLRADENGEQDQRRSDAPANAYVGLANLPQLDVQRKGKTFAEDSGAARFAAPVGGDRN